MKFHPDKNPDCLDYATKAFAKLNVLNKEDDNEEEEDLNIQTEKLEGFFRSEVFKKIKFKLKMDTKNNTLIFTINEPLNIAKKIFEMLKKTRKDIFKNSLEIKLINEKK